MRSAAPKLGASFVAVLTTAAADGVRAALLSCLAAAAVLAIRARFTSHAALGVLLAVAAAAVAGWGPGHGEQPAQRPATAAKTRPAARAHRIRTEPRSNRHPGA